MGAIALLLVGKGEKVSGSDLKESPLTLRLRESGAQVFLEHDAKHVQHPDFVIYSSAIDENNPELVAAKQKNIPILKRAQMLAILMKDKRSVTVGGAHGKTTTTSMIANLLINAGLHPTTAVGGIINGTTNNASLGDGEYFVAEVDESDGSFLYFDPFYSVITNIDFEHVDYYHNWENILRAYQEFVMRTQPGGHLFICGEDERLVKILKESGRVFSTYGFSRSHDLAAENIQYGGYSSQFDCFTKDKKIGSVHLKVPGKHNVLNALACIGVGLKLGIDFSLIRKSLDEFSGVQRRMQLKADAGNILVLDDYGHHPTEIAATMEAAKSFGKKRLIVVFQPHRYTRTKFLMEEFVKALGACDHLVLTDIYAASEKPMEGVNSQVLFDKIRSNGRSAVYLKKDEIASYLINFVEPGDLVLTVGAGDIGRISEDFSQKLKTVKKECIHNA